MKSLARNIWYLRKSKNWTQKQLAMKIGTKCAKISFWELGKKVPEDKIIIKLSKLFEVPKEKLKKEVIWK